MAASEDRRGEERRTNLRSWPSVLVGGLGLGDPRFASVRLQLWPSDQEDRYRSSGTQIRMHLAPATSSMSLSSTWDRVLWS